jgi:hypothetical protein
LFAHSVLVVDKLFLCSRKTNIFFLACQPFYDIFLKKFLKHIKFLLYCLL